MDFRSATATQQQQLDVERRVEVVFKALFDVPAGCQSVILELWRDKHIDYLLQGIRRLGPSFCVLDANRSWLCYWILNSIALLGQSLDADHQQSIIDFLRRCQDPNGGYGGGPGQMPHLATTYAAVNSLVTIGGQTALDSVNREKMLQFLLRMKDPSGGFRMHDAGEMDARGCYTAVAVASMLKIIVPSLVHNVANYIVSCQTYEGGIAAEPGAEAHGGYTFCGLATLVLINEAHRLDLPSLLDWVVFRQGRVEGGFQGRTNKLVDGCYSFWQGGVFPLFQRLTDLVQQQFSMSYIKEDKSVGKSKQECTTESTKRVRVEEETNAQHLHAIETGFVDEESSSTVTAEKMFPAIDCFSKTSLHIETVEEDPACCSRSMDDDMPGVGDSGLSFLDKDIMCGPLFNTHALQGYILLCSQILNGGLCDKPGKSRDYYHTCYCLSGLSTAQYSWSHRTGTPPPPRAVLGPYNNLLNPVHPLYNVVLERYYDANRYYSNV